ncbi:MAG: YncE family protein [Gemmatimonadales bacterium]
MSFGLLFIVPPASAQTPTPSDRSYLIFVASAAVDQLALIRFGPKGALVEHRTAVTLRPDQTAAPLGISLVPRGRFYYVIVANGFTNGELLQVKIAADSSHRESQPPDTLWGREPLGASPTAVQVSADGAFAWVTSGNSGTTSRSSVSVVYLERMVEVARIPTCATPTGSRLTADGSRHYSVCIGDDLLVEIDAKAMAVTRRLALARGTAPCGPAAVEPTTDGSKIYVACSRSDDVAEVDASTWTIGRRIPMGAGVSRLALTHDGKLLVGTNERGQSVSIVELASGHELARLPTRRASPAGVVVTPDDRYAFVTVAGAGAEPGTVEVIDLAALKTVATVDVGRGAGGIAFWKMQ